VLLTVGDDPWDGGEERAEGLRQRTKRCPVLAGNSLLGEAEGPLPRAMAGAPPDAAGLGLPSGV